MSEESAGIRKVFEVLSRGVPEVRKPGRKLSLGQKLIWSALALVIYEAMASVTLYGIPADVTGGVSPTLLNIIFASSIGTLTTLGIGPIVTAGLILQLLVGAEIIRLDLKKPEDRRLFTAASRLLTLVIALFQGAVYVYAGFFGNVDPRVAPLLFAQLVLATFIIMLLDETVQKWGLGSGISLFIAAGVAGQIFNDLFSPFVLQDGFYHGVFLALGQAIAEGKSIGEVFVRQVGGRGDLLGLISTVAIIGILIYTEGVRVEIPVAHSRAAGYRGTYPVKLLYVSNVPVILASTVFTNVYYIASIVWSRFNANNENQFLNLLGTFRIPEEGHQPVPTGGLAYYVMGPTSYTDAVSDPVRAVSFVLLMVATCVALGKFWISVAGLSPEKIAEQLISSGMQVPGFRRAPTVVASIIKRYIDVVTIIGSVVVGLLASAAGYVNAFGTGTGLLLMIGILYQYYTLLLRERVVEMYPAVSRVLGEG
ncbi:MAG: preprotein translocase subunit SecY [Thaumarchaeota archaeon]|nr:preprotein translocase subunit SecY [Candidatus Calditenuaceae archaeon]